MLVPFAGLSLWYTGYQHDHAWYVFVYTHIFASSYSYIWDVYMDFGLCRHFENDNRKYLRPKIMYPPSFYWYMCISDFILRFIWVPALWRWGQKGSVYDNMQGTTIILVILEAFRRSQWALVRVENEQCNNFEQYRTIPIIPPIIETDEKKKK